MKKISFRQGVQRALVAGVAGAALLSTPFAHAEDAAIKDTRLSCDSALIHIDNQISGTNGRIIGVIDMVAKKNVYSGASKWNAGVTPGVFLVVLLLEEHPNGTQRGFPTLSKMNLTLHATAGSVITIPIMSANDGRAIHAEQVQSAAKDFNVNDLPSEIAPAQALACAGAPASSATARWAETAGAPVVAVQRSTAADAAHVRLIDRHVSDVLMLYPQNDCRGGEIIAAPMDTSAVMRGVMGLPNGRLGMLDASTFPDGSVSEIGVVPGQVVNVGGAQCLGGISFEAKASTQYEVTMEPLGDKLCRYSVNRLEPGEGGAAVKRVAETGAREQRCHIASK
jgi:hypothetical protein